MTPLRVTWILLGLLGCATPSVAQQAASPTQDLRELPVTLVTDSSFREIHAWRGRVRSAIQRATADLTDSLGLYLRFTDELTWDPPANITSLEQALDAAMSAFPDTPGLLAVFIGDRLLEDQSRPQVGYAFLGHPALIVTASPSFRTRMGHSLTDHLAWTFRHELGHVFGVPHLNQPDIMNPVHEERTWEFSELSMDILHATRDMDFTAGRAFADCDLDILRDAYLVLADQNSLESASLINLGIAFYNDQRFADAAALFERAARQDNRPEAWFSLGLAYEALDDTAQARVAYTTFLERFPEHVKAPEATERRERLTADDR